MIIVELIDMIKLLIKLFERMKTRNTITQFNPAQLRFPASNRLTILADFNAGSLYSSDPQWSRVTDLTDLSNSGSF